MIPSRRFVGPYGRPDPPMNVIEYYGVSVIELPNGLSLESGTDEALPPSERRPLFGRLANCSDASCVQWAES
jgi:hypothetical protein